MADRDGIVELFRTVFKGTFNSEWWTQKYCSSPAGFFGEEGDIWVAESGDGRIVGHWGVVPERMKFGSETLVVAQAVDAATHPDFRGRGLFSRLVNHVCADALKRHRFIFGFPNEIYRGYEKMGWQNHRLINFVKFRDFARPLKSYFRNGLVVASAKTALRIWDAATRIPPVFRSNFPAGDEAAIREVEDFPEDIDAFWEKARREHVMALERDRTFLRWRFSGHLGKYRIFLARSAGTGEITGYLVLKKTTIGEIRDALDMVDLQTLPGQGRTLKTIVAGSLDEARKENLSVVRCRVPSRHPYASALRMTGFVPVGRALDYAGLYQPRLIVDPETSRTAPPDIRFWYHTLADTDYA